VDRFWESKQLEPNYWVSYMMKHCTDMSYRIQTEHIWLVEEVREGMHKFAFISSERCFFLLDIPHDASELSMCSKDSSVRSSSMMQRDLSIWLSVVFSRPSTLDCTHAWQVSCVTPCMASGATDKCDSSYVMVLGKELQAPWDPGGHAPQVSGDSGLRASRMLRRGECHGPSGPMHLVDWVVVLTDLQAQGTRA
jgi:hypothetical protein